MLALAEGRPVPPMRLIDGIWGIDAPRDAAHALQAQVSRLRKALPVGLSSDERGYRLDASEIEVDAIEFAARAARGSDALTEIGRAQVRTPVTNAYLICRLMSEKTTK